MRHGTRARCPPTAYRARCRTSRASSCRARPDDRPAVHAHRARATSPSSASSARCPKTRCSPWSTRCRTAQHAVYRTPQGPTGRAGLTPIATAGVILRDVARTALSRERRSAGPRLDGSSRNVVPRDTPMKRRTFIAGGRRHWAWRHRRWEQGGVGAVSRPRLESPDRVSGDRSHRDCCVTGSRSGDRSHRDWRVTGSRSGDRSYYGGFPAIRPARLRPGDTVALVSPATAAFQQEDLDIARESLEGLGLRGEGRPRTPVTGTVRSAAATRIALPTSTTALPTRTCARSSPPEAAGVRGASAAAARLRPDTPQSKDPDGVQRHHGAAERHPRPHRARDVSRPERRADAGTNIRSGLVRRMLFERPEALTLDNPSGRFPRRTY
jgi:hypothetical protein